MKGIATHRRTFGYAVSSGSSPPDILVRRASPPDIRPQPMSHCVGGVGGVVETAESWWSALPVAEKIAIGVGGAVALGALAYAVSR